MFGPEVRAPSDEPDWLLYLEAVLEYIDHHTELPVGDVATLLIECEFLATNALEAQPAIQAGIDESIAYSSKLTELLTQLRDKRQRQEHGRVHGRRGESDAPPVLQLADAARRGDSEGIAVRDAQDTDAERGE